MWGTRNSQPTTFSQDYRCYPVSFHKQNKSKLEEGDKILLPASALNALAQMNVNYPMLFRITNAQHNKSSHCGVMEFSAEEGIAYLPYWMMQNLLLSEGSILNVTNVSLSNATFVKFQPQTKNFLEISNPKAVLEKCLRGFSCLTEGDQICLSYNSKKYYVNVVEVKPNKKACIIETDMEVDFAAPKRLIILESLPQDRSPHNRVATRRPPVSVVALLVGRAQDRQEQ